MSFIAAKEAKNRFGELLDKAQGEPVRIQKHGRDVAVVLSMREYERLVEMEDQIWATRAERARKQGRLGAKASARLISELLDARD